MRHVHLIAFLFIVLPGIVLAQGANRYVIASDGGSVTTGTMVLDWTLGEPISGTGYTHDQMFTQGFQQPVLEAVRVEMPNAVSTRSYVDIEFTLHPNPVSSSLTLNMTAPHESDIDLVIVDGNGKLFFSKALPAGSIKQEIDVRALVPGFYFLRLYDEDKQLLDAFKISKIQ